MTRGGARVNSGPPPDPNALRRDRKDDKAGWVTLPATHDVPVPDWPLPPPLIEQPEGMEPEAHADLVRDHIDREHELWASLWAKPQAVMWQRLRCADEVAVYCRLRVLGERAGNVKVLSEARQRGDRIGVEPASMLRLRWRVGDGTAQAPAATPGAPAGRKAPAARSTRARALKLVNGGA